MTQTRLPLGKIPLELLSNLLEQAKPRDPRVLIGPGVGLDCAVIDMGPTLLVIKSDPITFATEAIGWYLVQVNANDIATTGATPRWLMVTMLLPEQHTTEPLITEIHADLHKACQEIGVSVVGGHTEVTYGLDRPILIGTMLGEVGREKLVTPQGARPGDRILLTKGVPVEATAILAREFPQRLTDVLTPEELRAAANYLTQPGISVLRDARIAVQAGHVTAMHDPTEGGIASALWELAIASGRSLKVDPASILTSDLARRVCEAFEINPLAAIASGALLLTADAKDTAAICTSLRAAGIPCVEIGSVADGPASVWQQTDAGDIPLPRPERDEIARVYEENRQA